MRIKLINNKNIFTVISINPNIRLHELYALAVKKKVYSIYTEWSMYNENRWQPSNNDLF